MLRRIIAATIWAQVPSPLENEVTREVRRGLLPVFDGVMILTALLALRGGMPTFVIAFNETVSAVGASLLLVSAVGCLIGVSFPKLWGIELVSKAVLVMILTGYAIALLVASWTDPARGFVGGAVLAVAVLPAFGFGWLLRQARKGRRWNESG